VVPAAALGAAVGLVAAPEPVAAPAIGLAATADPPVDPTDATPTLSGVLKLNRRSSASAVVTRAIAPFLGNIVRLRWVRMMSSTVIDPSEIVLRSRSIALRAVSGPWRQD
jgi:hypothetical protein